MTRCSEFESCHLVEKATGHTHNNNNNCNRLFKIFPQSTINRAPITKVHQQLLMEHSEHGMARTQTRAKSIKSSILYRRKRHHLCNTLLKKGKKDSPLL